VKRLEGKTAIITGAAGGIGGAAAVLFARHGATVYACDVLDKPKYELPEGCHYRHLDIADEQGWRALADEILRDHGSIDILLNNAAIAILKPVVELTKAEFERVVAVNLTGTFLGMKYVGDEMMRAGKGSIINICSSAGLQGNNAMGAYTASKFGIRGLSKVAALEMGLSGVRVNSVYPGPINTDLTNPERLSPDALKDHELSRRQPIQRFAEPEEIANVCLFLASDEASYVTGAEISADGGMTIGFYMAVLPGGPQSA